MDAAARHKKGGTMEADKRYFIEGLIIVFGRHGDRLAWLAKTATATTSLLHPLHESVSGLALGDPMKFHGVTSAP